MKRLKLPIGTRAVAIELVANGTWRVWTGANEDFTRGTYYELGCLEVTRVTERDDGIDTLVIDLGV